MGYCPECNQTYPDGTRICAYCKGELTEPETEKKDWVEVWYGPIRFKGLVHKALTDAGIENRDPPPSGMVARAAYHGPDQAAPILVPAENIKDAQKILAALKKEIPDAFPEGTL